jgi:hypothetical protein
MAIYQVRDDYLGIDETSTDYYKFALHPEKRTYKISEHDTVDVTILANTAYASGVILHSLGYIPVVQPTILYDGKGYPYMGQLMPYIEVPAHGGGTTILTCNVTWSTTQVLFEVSADAVFGNPASNETLRLEAFIQLDQQQ